MKIIRTLILGLFLASINYSQVDDNRIILTGDFATDSKIILNNFNDDLTPQFVYPSQEKKSPILAGAMSLIIPGSGEIYVGEYLKAGIFLAIEAVVVTTAIVYDNKGDNKTIEFQNYADDYTNPDHNWSVVQYAEWLNQYEGASITINPDESLPPWERVDWNELNAAEKGSHKLPPHGEQQYYELIGKYHQYSSGWNDFTGGGNEDQISPNFTYYSGMRGEANDFYSVSSTAVIGIYVNHFLSALDAVWSASTFNKNLAVKVRMESIQLANRAEFYPKIYFTYSF
jgi:hypothetical protein